MDITELAKYGVDGIAIAVIVGFIFLFKYLLDFINKQRNDYLCEIEKIDKRHSKNVSKLTKSLDKNTRVADQTYQYLKLRNGSIEKAIKGLRGPRGFKGEKGNSK